MGCGRGERHIAFRSASACWRCGRVSGSVGYEKGGSCGSELARDCGGPDTSRSRASSLCAVLLVCAWTFFLPVTRAAESDLAARLIILANSRQPESLAGLAQYYAERRGVPATNIVALPLPEEETVNWRTFVDQVCAAGAGRALSAWLDRGHGQQPGRPVRPPALRLRLAEYFLPGHLSRCAPPARAMIPSLVAADSKFATQFNRNESAVYRRAQPAGNGQLRHHRRAEQPAVRPGRTDVPRCRASDQGDAARWAHVGGRPAPLCDSALEGERRGLAGRYYVDRKGPHGDGDEWLGAVQRQLDALGF